MSAAQSFNVYGFIIVYMFIMALGEAYFLFTPCVRYSVSDQAYRRINALSLVILASAYLVAFIGTLSLDAVPALLAATVSTLAYLMLVRPLRRAFLKQN